MNPRPFAWTAGLLLLGIGVAGYVPPLVFVEDSVLRVEAGVGGPYLLGLFPVSEALNAIHLLLGGWGMWAGRSLSTSVDFARRAAAVAAVLTIFGLIPGADTLFGLAPLYGNNLLLHGLLATVSFLFGWLYRRPEPVSEPQAAVLRG